MVDFQSRDDISKGTQSPKYIAQHTLTADKTLSYLALKYYGHATPPPSAEILWPRNAALLAQPIYIPKGEAAWVTLLFDPTTAFR